MKLIAEPIELKQAQDFINRLHRHHAAAVRDKFRIAAKVVGGVLSGLRKSEDQYHGT